MSRLVTQTDQKALEINLDENLYGTFAEIGAGQEVARHFFQVGGAAGTPHTIRFIQIRFMVRKRVGDMSARLVFTRCSIMNIS